MQVVIIGGGAAGFFAAITCAENYPDSQVILLEATQKCLHKVRISGGGRCNVTHNCFDPATLITNYPRGAKSLRSAFSRFQPQDTINWFNQRGVKVKTESDNRIFPVSDDSATIVNCLYDSAIHAGVRIYEGSPVSDVEKNEQEQFIVKLKSGEIIISDRLLLATGSNPIGYKLAQKLGHNIINPVPSLFTFNIKDQRLIELAGISAENVKLRLTIPEKNEKLEQTGPLLITHWGLSGPAVLKLSAWGARLLYENHYQATLTINWLPEFNSETLKQQLLQTKQEWSKKLIISNCPVNLSKRLWQKLTEYVEINPQQKWAELSNKTLNQLILELTQGTYKITGKGVFKDEFVTCGGVNLKEIDFKTMESKICSGLYFAGEILDIDGITGGFNFQNAWTTGWIAGKGFFGK
jgi:predicted Rossmann fold flavoprotein